MFHFRPLCHNPLNFLRSYHGRQQGKSTRCGVATDRKTIRQGRCNAHGRPRAPDHSGNPNRLHGVGYRLGIGGLPKGRIVEIYGPESSGKTTLTLSVIAEAQRQGATCAFVDAEHALDPDYAGKLGVNVDDLLVSQPDTGEQALEITDMLVRSNAVDVIIVDSVAALVPKAEIEGEMGDAHVGRPA